MSILNRIGKMRNTYNYANMRESDFISEPEIIPEKIDTKKKNLNYKHLKYVCNKCGAFVNKDQGFCGICKGSNFRKAYKKEIEQTLSLLRDVNIVLQ